MSTRTAQTPWEAFKADPNPLAKVREVKEALPAGPGLPAMYEEIRRDGTLLGVPILNVGRNLYAPRKRVVEKVERGE